MEKYTDMENLFPQRLSNPRSMKLAQFEHWYSGVKLGEETENYLTAAIAA